MTLLLRISPKVEHCDVLLVSHKNYQVYVDGQPYDRVLEGYHRDFVEKGVRHCLLELGALRTSYFLPKLSPRIEYVNMFILKVLGCLGSYVFISFRHLNTYTAEVNAKLRDKFDGHSINEKSLITYLSYLRVMKMYFKIYLKRRGIKEVYQATYYDPVGLAINAAANELGIRTYCVQHGGQSRNNPAFGRWSKVPLFYVGTRFLLIMLRSGLG